MGQCQGNVSLSPIRFRLSVMLLLMLFPLSASANGTSSWQNAAFIEQAFEQVALKNEYDTKTHRVRKWLAPVSLFIEHDIGDVALHRQLVDMHLAHLASITGHPMALVNDSKFANITLVFTRQSHWHAWVNRLMGPQASEHLQGAVCIGHFSANSQGEMQQAFVVIPVDQAVMHGKLVACVVEEITQVLGLPNDSDKVYPSIFNDKTPQDLLTGLDGVLLKLLYSDAVKAGMTAAQVKPVVHTLVSQYLQDGTVANADALIRQGKLYPLLGL